MVLFFILALALSIAGMAALIGLKRYELSTGHVLFASARPIVGNFFKQALWWVEKVLPALVRVYTIRALRLSKIVLQRALARSILYVEHTLERVHHTVRERTTTVRAPGEASVFLREVAEHKRKLSSRVRKPKVHEVNVEDVETIAHTKNEFEVE